MDKIIKENNYKEGIIRISHKGIGKVTIKESGDIIEIPHSFLRTALHGDTVKIFLHPQKNNDPLSGEVRQIIRRSNRGFSGILEFDDGAYFLIPSDLRMYTDILIPKDKLNGAQIGQKIYVEITDWHDQKKSPIGQVVEVLGVPNEHNVEMRSIALEKGFSEIFPEHVLKEAEKLKHLGISDQEIKKRKDLRQILTFTIDPHDAKDFDDAISFRELDSNRYEIGVHIADVTHYIKTGSLLDKEAYLRGTSVYLVDRTIPMLPEILSNDLCSLKPGQDKLTFSIIFELNKDGKILKEWIGKTIIHSKKRFSYEEAEKSLTDTKGLFHKELSIINKLAKKIAKDRIKYGAILLDQEEVKFELDKNGLPIKVYSLVRGDSHKLIEEFMLLANRRIAELMSKKKRVEKIIFFCTVFTAPQTKKKCKIYHFF